MKILTIVCVVFLAALTGGYAWLNNQNHKKERSQREEQAKIAKADSTEAVNVAHKNAQARYSLDSLIAANAAKRRNDSLAKAAKPKRIAIAPSPNYHWVKGKFEEIVEK
jgi:flagellar basal body-associated protein FliL